MTIAATAGSPQGETLSYRRNTPSVEMPRFFQMEVLAIARAVAWLIQSEKPRVTKAVILSDSQSAIAALHSRRTDSALVYECKMLIQKALDQGILISIQWVRGHSNITGNEFADYLAKMGAESTPFGPPPYTPVAPITVKHKMEQLMYSNWASAWRLETTCRQTRHMKPTPTANKHQAQLLRLAPKELKALVAFLTGHCKLERHRYLMGMADDPNCRLCQNGLETPIHLSGECFVTADARNVLASSEGSINDILNFISYLEGLGLPV
jgi:ribonuclease HI